MSDVESARYHELKAGYESYYLVAREQGGARAIWIRYTAHKPAKGPVSGAVWCTFFRQGAPRVTKVATPSVGHTVGWLQVGESSIAPGLASASLPEASWDLTFGGSATFRHLPAGWLYTAPVPRTKPVSIHPTAEFGGRMSFAGEEVDVTGWTGMVGHNWGTQHAERWIWLHGLWDGGWIDLILARIKIAGRVTPWAALGGLSLDGTTTPLGRRTLWGGVTVRERPGGCEFELPGNITGTVEAPLEHFVGWTYADPDGGTHDVVNCSTADLTITVDGHTFTAKGVYELGMRERDHGVPIQPFADG